MGGANLSLRQRVRDAMNEADKKTAHLEPESEERIRQWMRVFHETLWRVAYDPGHSNQARIE